MKPTKKKENDKVTKSETFDVTLELWHSSILDVDLDVLKAL